MDTFKAGIIGGAVVGVGAFILPSFTTQDMWLSEKPETQKMLWYSWAAMAAITTGAGIYTKWKPLILIGVGMAAFGYWWTHQAKHPMFTEGF